VEMSTKVQHVGLALVLLMSFSGLILGGLQSPLLPHKNSFYTQAKHLALVRLDGMIVENAEKSSLFGTASPSMRTRQTLLDLAEEESVAGVLLRINSPGGTVAMSQELHDAVVTLRQKKPVVVSMGDTAASGAYYTAVAADYIVANPGTLTASIGVILQNLNYSKLMKDKLGIEAITLKSGPYKDLLSPYRPHTGSEHLLLQTLIQSCYQDFLNAVISGRTRSLKTEQEKLLRRSKIRAVADGRIVDGNQALRVGLIDALGSQQEAYKYLNQRVKGALHLRADLSLKDAETSPSWMQLLENSVIKPMMAQGPDLKEWLPSSFRYSNQLLWMMEGL
jgi:protease IV